MEKITGKSEREEKQRRTNRWLTIIVLGVLVISSIGYAFLSSPGSNSSEGNPDIKDDKVYESNGYWVSNFEGQSIIFSTSPERAKEAKSNFSISFSDYLGNSVYYADSSNALGNEIANNLGKFISIRQACYGRCAENLPEKNCSDFLIVWNKTGENKVYQEEKCIFIDGDISAVDNFLYRIFGLI